MKRLLLGWRSLKTVASNMTPLTRVENSNSVKYPCRPFATVSKYQRSHADTHCLTNSEIERESLKKRPPGEGPGEFLHQRGQFQRASFVSKDLLPLYPMIVMVSLGIGLAISTMYRMLIRHPTLILAKGKRRGNPIPELGDEDLNRHMSEDVQVFYEKSPYRTLGLKLPGPLMRLNHKFFHQPPQLTPSG